MAEFVWGVRSCEAADPDLPGACEANQAAGGWGPATGGQAVPIPSRNVFFLNNLVVNPPRQGAKYAHFWVRKARPGEAAGDVAVGDKHALSLGVKGVESEAAASALVIAGRGE
jgi:hypothetical protein